ncbi:C2 calcium-dependent membrane targeting [Artemisia annua]|uniref:C2 calcium-dependent membrane targeting n=1 Tax=Artemisia annua TaxID=35608 RepID=A0A2U1M7X3_ARTAN|nr:C2 calcium-dependent membrane targeting [Artemisia annua]
MSKEKLVVEVLGAHNLMPKDGEGSSSAFVEVEFEGQRQRTQVKYKDLNPVWNEKLVFHVNDVADLPYRTIEVNVFNEKKSNNSRNFLGKVRVSGTSIAREGQDDVVPQLHTLDKRSLFSHQQMGSQENKKMTHLNQMGQMVKPDPGQNHPGEVGMKPVVITSNPGPQMSGMNMGVGGVGGAWLVFINKVVEAMRNWTMPVYSSMFVVTFMIMVLMPELIVPSVLCGFAVTGLWRYRLRPRYPPHMDTRLSYAEGVHPDELDEEFDSFPTSRSAETVRIRYDRLRSVAGRIQTVVGDMATQGERFQALLSWRDPRASFLFVVICFLAAFGFYLVPIRWVVAIWGLWFLRPPRFRSKLPSSAVCFFKRLPTMADSML